MTHKWIWQNNSWPHFVWDSAKLADVLAQARLSQGKLLGALKNIESTYLKNARLEVFVEDAVKTSEIEGEKVDALSVRSSMARKLGLSVVGLPKPNRYVDGLVDVLLDATQNYDSNLTLARVCGWQAALFPTGYSGLYKIRAGKLRGNESMQIVSGPIGSERVHFEAPPREKLNEELKRFFKWFNGKESKAIDGLLRAAIAHFWFITIHPFEDGNGRITRAITDMALAQDEKNPLRLYSLSAQIMQHRNSYYEILEKTSHYKSKLDITDWFDWFLECFKGAVIRSQEIINNVMLKAKFWQRHAQTVLNIKQQKVLNRLLDDGIDEFRSGMNTRKYSNLAKVSRATAYRDLVDLVEKGCLVRLEGRGRSSAYKINWP
jgi:Fic family protein